jgi:nucleoside-diphosphate-sugar epimerase
MSVLLSFGHGYSSQALARELPSWQVIGTNRSGRDAIRWPGTDMLPLLDRADHLLISAAPDAHGDPVLAELAAAIAARAGRYRWVGYLSTTGVYGDSGGDWVNEDSPREPATERGRLRLIAEDQWLDLWCKTGLPVHLFRLAGIYGPGRGPFEKVRNGTARRIVKPGQVFSRIHVADIVQVLRASMARPDPGAAYNVCDDDPAPPQDVIAEAARLLDVPIPPAENFETAMMTPMARSFYAESKRVSNRRIKQELGVVLHYPDYRSGLRALMG